MPALIAGEINRALTKLMRDYQMHESFRLQLEDGRAESLNGRSSKSRAHTMIYAFTARAPGAAFFSSHASRRAMPMALPMPRLTPQRARHVSDYFDFAGDFSSRPAPPKEVFDAPTGAPDAHADGPAILPKPDISVH